MGKLQDFRIEFERPGATYAPGEIVTGKVILTLSGTKNMREIRIEAKGEAEVHWTKQRRKSNGNGSHRVTDHYKGSETYFSVSNRLVGATGGESSATIPSGTSTYPFSFHIPQNIPCSFEHVLGFVRYTVKAVIDRPWRFDHKIVSAFTVVADYDLNAHRNLATGISDEIKRRFRSCCCLGNAGGIKAIVKSRVSGFVPGETIQLDVSYDNSSTSVEVKRMKLYLYKELQFFASTPFPDKKFTSDVVKKVKIGGPFPKKGEKSLCIEVPPMPPSKLEHCTLINVSYKLVLIIETSGLHRDIDRSYPIEIGTVPLYYQVSGQAQPSLVPSAPPIDQVTPNTQLLPHQQQAASQPIGFVVMSAPPYMAAGAPVHQMPEMPPPSYEECIGGSNPIADPNEQGMIGSNTQFAPKYPVYKFPMPMPCKC
ncbi:hypothetical protein TSAR_008783 [Trichomalopsis sarcophagae]|uniref:Arrestin C-terminal-like domain-containing protein n=1 Tax=Trichomalopsis sarcophagae TaxID=543379 RepID=A0A232EPR8_9HYME|nr:hypothetical protein TSAR_008783 [Trichomalopsis sarcophagae]